MALRRRPPRSGRQRGQASTEYAMACAVLVLALCVRVPALGDRSIATALADGLHAAMSAFWWALSIPI